MLSLLVGPKLRYSLNHLEADLVLESVCVTSVCKFHTMLSEKAQTSVS